MVTLKRTRRALCALALPAVLPGCGQPAGPPVLSAELAAGKAIVEDNCRVCHAQGINGAPIIGNEKMWAPRLQQGLDTLVRHAIDGFNMDMMPPRGGNPALDDRQIRLAVRYMVSRAATDNRTE